MFVDMGGGGADDQFRPVDGLGQVHGDQVNLCFTGNINIPLQGDNVVVGNDRCQLFFRDIVDADLLAQQGEVGGDSSSCITTSDNCKSAHG